MNISKKLSDSLYIGGFICTLLVIAIHYNSKEHINTESLGFTFNYYLQEYLTNGIARVAVPYFAIVSGFFFFLKFRKIQDYKKNIQSRFWTLLVPYLLTSLLFFLIESTYQYYPNDRSLFYSPSDALSTILLSPISIQHWFLRDLIILSLISPLLLILKNSKLSLIPLFLLILFWLFDFEFMPKASGRYLIQIEVLSCFFLGGILSDHVNKIEAHIKNISAKIIVYFSCIYLLMVFLRVYIQPDFMNWYNDSYMLSMLILQNITKFLGIYLVFLISYRIHSKFLLKLSAFSFFLYLFHFIPLNRIINKFTDYFLEDQYRFYFNFPLSVFLTLLLAFLLAKFFPKIYSVLTGDRSNKRIKHEVNSCSKT